MSARPKSVEPSSRAKVFKTGGSQAVRLPKECRLPGDEVLVRKAGSMVILAPLPTAYSEEFLRMVLGHEDEVIARPPQGRAQKRAQLR